MLDQLLQSRLAASALATTTSTAEAEAEAAFVGMEVFSLGCMFAQPIVDTFFAGVMFMQIASYFTYQRNDKWWTQVIVLFAATISTIITLYLWYFAQYLFVQNFGIWTTFLETGKLAWFPLLDSICSAGIQAYFTYRAYLLNKRNIIIPLIIGPLILTSLASTIAVKVIFGSLSSLSEANKVRVPELIWLSSIMAADILITLLIVNGLLRSKTGWAHTDKAITRLLRITFESQLGPTIISIAFVIEFVQAPDSLLGSLFQGIQSKLYTVGLMYSLNSRVSFKSMDERTNATGHVFAMTTRREEGTGVNDIRVDVETYVHDTQDPYANDFARDQRKVRDDESLSDIQDSKSLGFNSQAHLTQPSHII